MPLIDASKAKTFTANILLSTESVSSLTSLTKVVTTIAHNQAKTTNDEIKSYLIKILY